MRLICWEASISDQRAIDQYCRFTKNNQKNTVSSHVTSWKSLFITQFFFPQHVATCCMRTCASRAGGRGDFGRPCWLGVFPTARLKGLRPPVEIVVSGTVTSAKQSASGLPYRPAWALNLPEMLSASSSCGKTKGTGSHSCNFEQAV